MIDGQREYTTGKLPLAGIDAAVEEGARLLAFARAQAHAGDPCHPSRAAGRRVVRSAAGGRGIHRRSSAPRAGETVLIKSLPNAFAGTRSRGSNPGHGPRARSSSPALPRTCASARRRARRWIMAFAPPWWPRPRPRAICRTLPVRASRRPSASSRRRSRRLSDRFSVVIQDTGALAAAARPRPPPAMKVP